MIGAQQSTPDAAAKSIDLSRRTGLPADLVERNLPKVESDQKLNEYDTLLTKAPKLADWLSADQVNAKVASSDGDFSKLTFLEHTINEIKRPVFGFMSDRQMGNYEQGVRLSMDLEEARTRKAAGEPLSMYDEGLLKDESSVREVVRAHMIDTWASRQKLQQMAAELPQRPNIVKMQKASKDGDFGQWWDAFAEDPAGAFYTIGLQSLWLLPLQLGAGALAGAKGVGLVSFGAEYMGTVIEAMEENGVDINDPGLVAKAFANPDLMAKVRTQATIKAGTIAAVDALSFGVASKFMGIGRSAMTRTATNIPAQVVTQGALGGVGEAGGSVLAGMKVDIHSVASEIIGEGMFAPVEVATANWRGARREDMTRAEAEKFGALPPLEQYATGNAMAIDKLVTTANDTRLATIAPEKLQEFIASVSARDQMVFVPAEVVATYMQDMTGVNAQAFADRLGITSQLARIAATGEDVAIPLAMYVTGAKDAHAAWREQIRTEVDGFSVRQAQEWEKAKAAELQAMQDRFEEQIAAGVIDDPRTVVYQQVLAMAKANGYTNDVAAPHAALYAARYHARAERNPGRYADALDAFQKAGLGKGMTIRTELAGVTRALGPDQLDVMLNSIRSGRDPATIKTKSGNAVPVSFKPDRGTLEIARRLSKGWGPEKHIPEPQSLTNFVRKRGGINIASSEAGDLRAGDLAKLPGLLRQKKGEVGQSADIVAQAAKDAGFIFGDETQFGSGVDVNAFISALIADASNRTKSYPDDADTAAWQAQQDYFAQNDRWLKEGVEWDPKGREPIEIAWFLSQDAGEQRLMALRERETLGPDSSLEASYLTDAERAKAKTLPPSTDPGDIFRTRRQQLADAIASMGLDPSKMTNDQIRAAIDKEIEGLTLDQPAYHGSPHVFDRFSLDKIGTGEGAQAYGWGLYFAGKKAVAEYYRDTLTGRTARGNQIIQYGDKMLVRADGEPLIVQDDWRPDLEALVAEAVENGHTLTQEIAAQRQRVKDAGILRRMMGGPYSETLLTFLERKDAKLVDMPKGRLFEVEIPDDGAYLLWDKPLRKQSANVQEIVTRLAEQVGFNFVPESSGSEIYNVLKRLMTPPLPADPPGTPQGWGYVQRGDEGQKAASLALRAAGIPGIQYLDASSRGKGRGTSNYVLFDDSLVEVKSYEQAARGSITFSDGAALIRLFEGRDLSTLAHESGHLWLAELEFDVKHVGAGEQAKADWQAVLDFVGSKDGYITREQHELFARAFETYLMEGKAPSEGLRNVFRQFKAWLLSIYRNLVKLQAPISPEMRQVFDRLLATDEEIAGAQNAQSFNPVFTDAKSAEMTEAEFQAYTKRVVQVVDEAEQKVLGKVMATIRRQRTKEVAAEKAKIRGEVKDELMSDPGHAALHFLRNGSMYAGETPEVLKGRKLSRAGLIALVGQEGLNGLPMGIHAEDGIAPDDLAQVFGLGNGLELVERLMQIQAEQVAMRAKGDSRAVINARIAEETQRRLTESLGDPLNDGSIEAEAMAAVHSDKQGALLASELKVLARKAGHSGAISLDDIKTWAVNAIGEMSSYQATQFVKYQRAERMAGQKVQRALVKGDFMAAFRSKQDQLVNFALYQEAKKAADDADSIRKRMDRYASAAQIKSMDQEALNAIHEVLEEFDFKKRSGPLLAERTLFNAFAQQQKELGIEVLEPPRLKGAGSKHFSQMTMDELRGLSDTVEQMAKLGRMKKELLDNQKKRDFEAVVAEGLATAAARPQRGVSRDDTGLTTLQERLGKLISGIKSGDSSLIKLETLFEWLDGDKTGRGIFTRLGFKPFADAQGRERDRLVDLNAKLKALYALVPDEQRAKWLEVHDIQTLPKPGGRAGKFNKTQLIAMALNIGNQSSLEKLTAGMKWDEQAVRTTLDKYLTREEWQFVQNVWDLIDTQWPELKAVHERVTGLAPPKIEAIEVPTPFGPLRGGYYPAVYDPNLSTKAAKIGAKADVAATVGEIFPGGAFRPSTRAGATHARTGFEAPIRLSLDVIVQHLTDVSHDIEFREAILNAHKFFSDDRIKQAIIDAVGPEYEEQIDPWLKNIAHEWVIDRQGLNAVQKFANTLRTNVVIVGLGFRISTMLAQTAGYSNSVQRLGAVRMADGMQAFAKSPIQQFEFVHGKSAEMRHRANDLERDLRAAQLKMQGKTGFLNDVRRFAFKGIAWADAAVSIPTWIGAYNQGLADHKMTDEQAVYYADKMVRDTQGSGAAKDMAAIQRGGPLLKLFTMFYSYFNVFYNRQRSLARDVRDPGVSWGSVVAQTFWLLVLPSLLSPLLTGQGPGDDEEWAAWAARNVFFGLLTGVPYGRDIANTASNKVAGKSFGDPKLSPVEGFGTNLVHLGRDIAKMASGEETSKGAIKNLFNVAGVMTALPLGQPGSTAQYVWDVLIEGSENPENLLEWMRGLTIGPEHKK